MKVKDLKCCGNCMHYRMIIVKDDETFGCPIISDYDDACEKWEWDKLTFSDRGIK